MRSSQELQSSAKTTYLSNNHADFENFSDRPLFLKESFSVPQSSPHGQWNQDLKLSKDIKSFDDEASAKLANTQPSSYLDSQRTLFQRNLDAINQSQRTIQDFGLQTLKRDEKPLVDTSSDLQASRKDQPYEGSCAKIESSMNQDDSDSSKRSEGNDAEKSKENNIQNSRAVESISRADSLLDLSESNEEKSGHEKRSTTDVSEQKAVDIVPQTEKIEAKDNSEQFSCDEKTKGMALPTHEEIKAGTGGSLDPNETPRADHKPMIVEQVVLCLVQGEDKENVSPIILDERCEKSAPTTDQNVHDTDGARLSEIALMDQDKEPAFAEENLQNSDNFILDEDSLSRKNKSLNEECIFEIEKMVLEGEKEDLSKPTMASTLEGKQPEGIPEATQVSLFETIISQTKDLISEDKTGPGQRINHEKPLPPIKIIPSKLNKPSNPSLQRGNLLNLSSNIPKSTINLAKRPPLITPASAKKPETPYQSMKNQGMSKLKHLSAFKERSSPYIAKGEFRSNNKERESLVPFVFKSSEKPSRKPSVPKIAPLTPKKNCPMLNDAKICPEIAARLAEAERVLLQKKPPVPKFLAQGKCSVKKSQELSSLDYQRKPPVPKFSDLIKKK